MHDPFHDNGMFQPVMVVSFLGCTIQPEPQQMVREVNFPIISGFQVGELCLNLPRSVVETGLQIRSKTNLDVDATYPPGNDHISSSPWWHF